MKAILALAFLAFSLDSPAADLSIALGGDVTSMDPHFHNLTPNNNIGAHVFDTLVMKDPGGGSSPASPSRGAQWTTPPGSSGCARA